MKPRKYKITDVRTGRCVGKYRATESVGAVKALIKKVGFKLSEFEVSMAAPRTGSVLKVTRRGEEPVLVIVRDTHADHAPISNFPESAQTAIPGLT